MHSQGLFLYFLFFSFFVHLIATTTDHGAALRRDYYRKSCPDVEQIVRSAVEEKARQTIITAPATLRLFFHDCFIQGCDASIIVFSSNGTAEKDHPDNLSLAGDGFDTVIKAKAAIDRVPHCKNKVSCADILAMAARDAVHLVGGPYYEVELGRLDGKISTMANAQNNLPQPNFRLGKLKAMFGTRGLSVTDLIALSGAHSIGFSLCNKVFRRIYNFKSKNRVDPTLNPEYAEQLKQSCPKNADFRAPTHLDPTTPDTFDNVYYKNLQQGKGLFTSDQSLFINPQSKNIVNLFSSNKSAFEHAFVSAMTKLGRIGVKTGKNGEIRHDCAIVN